MVLEDKLVISKHQVVEQKDSVTLTVCWSRGEGGKERPADKFRG